MDRTGEVRLADLPDAPPPSSELTAIVAATRPVGMYAPGREMGLLGLFFVGWGLLAAAAIGLRGDLPALPVMRYCLGALAWIGVTIAGVVFAVRPARGQVLPSITTARAASIVLPMFAAGAAIVFLVDSRLTYTPELSEAFGRIVHCMSIGLGVGLLPLALSLMRGRHRFLVGRSWLGGVLGVAAGSLGACALHFVCPVGGLVHVVFGHAGALVAGALLGAGLAQVVKPR